MKSKRMGCCCLLIAIIIIVVVVILAIVFGSYGEPIAISRTTPFENSHYEADRNWPTCEDINGFNETNIKLWKIHHQGNGYSLASLRLEFTNGVMSQRVSNGRTTESGFNTITLDLTKTIRKVEMQVKEEGGWGNLNHIKFISDEGENLGEARFYNGGGNWQTIHIPEGKEIIGFFCNISVNEDDMQSLGLNLWTPPY